ncbi:MAG: DNA mismatch repair protein MutS [Anaerolineae bacterium]
MTTPVRRQYLQIKGQYPDCIVFFRLGDFYETFDDDARIVAQVCDIVLTSRPVGEDERVPLAGVPYHTLETYVGRLIDAGHKVAIAEQTGDAGARGLMERQVVRVVTPGTVIEPGLLDSGRNNYLVAIIPEQPTGALALTDITTGEFAGTEVDTSEGLEPLWEELLRVSPAELLVPDDQVQTVQAWAAERGDGLGQRVTTLENWRWDLEHAREILKRQLRVGSLAGFGLEDKAALSRCAGAIVQYLEATQRTALTQLGSFTIYNIHDHMSLDPATRRNLELVEGIRSRGVKGSLLAVLDMTVTPMGARLLRRWVQQPLVDVSSILRRQGAVAVLYREATVRAAIASVLRSCSDLERVVTRVMLGVAGPRELQALRATLEAVPTLAREVACAIGDGKSSDEGAALVEALGGLDPCADVVGLVRAAIAEDPPSSTRGGGYIRQGYSAELDSIVAASHAAKLWIANLEQRERERTGIRSLKVGYNKVFGYYIEVTKAHLAAVPGDYVRKQTLVNGERYVTPELKEQEALVLHAESRLAGLEEEIYRDILRQVGARADVLLRVGRALAQLDVFVALAEVARRNAYCRPVVDDSDVIEILGGRHPVVERGLPPMGFVANDVRLSSDERVMVVTGPNMSGKSTYLRQVALIVLLAQIGSFVPADAAHIGVVDRIFTRVGAQDEISAGQSTFMVEMVETALILSQCTPRSLLIVDEVGRGTSTYDGLAIAQAVLEYIHNSPLHQAKTLFATHFHELTTLEKYLPRVRNWNVAVVEDGERVVFLHKIVPGGADRSYGIHVAEIAGVPRPVIKRAREILKELERRSLTSGAGTARAGQRLGRPAQRQLPLFGAGHPVVEALRGLRLDEMSPLEALSKLYDLQRLAREEQSLAADVSGREEEAACR